MATASEDLRGKREREAYPAEKARGGEIILHHRWQRLIFIAGLAAAIVLAAVVAILAKGA
jgi:hypothetical protein